QASGGVHRRRHLDAWAQGHRRGIARLRDRHSLLHLAMGTKLRRTTRATLQMRLNIVAVPAIELAVEEGVKQDFGFCASHVGSPSSAIHAFRSMERARAKRDITVPTGAPTTSAISRYDKSLISRSTIASRNGSGSSATRRRIVSASH